MELGCDFRSDKVDFGVQAHTGGMRACFLVSLLLSLSIRSLSAQEALGFSGEPMTGQGDWVLRVGVMALATPRYPGAQKDRLVAFPVFSAQYKQRLYFGSSRVSVGAGMGVHLIRHRAFSWDLGFGIGDKRPESRDPRLAGMGDRQASLWAGTSLRFGSRWIQSGLTLASGLRDEAGQRATFSLGTSIPLHPKWRAGLNVSTTWSNERNMRYDFGISEEQALRRQGLQESGSLHLDPKEVGPYSPKAGLRDVTTGLFISFSPDRQQRWFSFLGLSRFQGEAAQSPLTSRDGSVSGGLGYSYLF